MADSVFSLEINEKQTRCADISIVGSKIRVSALGEQNTAPNFFSDDSEKTIETQAEIITKLCTELKIGKKPVHIVIPDAYSFAQVMEFSRLNEKELLSAVKYQADQFIPLPLEEVVFDVEVLQEDPQAKKNTVLIVAAPKIIVERMVKATEYAGLITDSLESELTSLSRQFSSYMTASMKPESSTSMLVNIGYSTTSLYLFKQPDGLLVEIRTIKTGYSHFVKELIFNMELKEEKAVDLLNTVGFEKDATYDLSTYLGSLLREIVGEMNKFVYVSQNKYNLPLTHLFSVNYDSQLRSIDKKLGELMNIPFSSFALSELLEKNPITDSYSGKPSSFVSVIGACQR